MNQLYEIIIEFLTIFKEITLLGVLDIFIITLILYQFLVLIENTKAEQLIKGGFFVFLLMILSEGFGLRGLNYLIKSLLNFGFIAILILFQPELRQILERVGRGVSNIKKQSTTNSEKILDALSEAVFNMANTKTGALIVLPQITKIEEITNTATKIDSEVSSSIIENIFVENTPLHDGAIVIEDDRIVAANCILPLTNKNISNQYGTRHRAAVGISEYTDAIAITVSEETGKVCICVQGKLVTIKTKEIFKKKLGELLITNKGVQRCLSKTKTK